MAKCMSTDRLEEIKKAYKRPNVYVDDVDLNIIWELVTEIERQDKEMEGMAGAG